MGELDRSRPTRNQTVDARRKMAHQRQVRGAQVGRPLHGLVLVPRPPRRLAGGIGGSGTSPCDGLGLNNISAINDPARTLVWLDHSLELISVVNCRAQSPNASAAATYSTRTPPDRAPEMAHSGIAHAASSNALETYTTSASDGYDHAVRRLRRGNWHGLN